jgi:acetyl esterase/lipase
MSQRVAGRACVVALLVTAWGVPPVVRMPGAVVAAAGMQDARVIRDITYATVGGKALQLDLHMPSGVARPPLLVWVHGGAWREGSRTTVRPEFVRHGIATASVSYRLSTEARFPAMVHDIKAAIRFLRARASMYGYRAERIAIAGDSAGAHLAALVGVSNGVVALEGAVGDVPAESSDIQAIVDYYGASNLSTILQQSTPFGLNVRVPALDLLLGGQPDVMSELARLASVVTHVDSSDPPLLIFHGDQDPQMPISQSHELHGAYKRRTLDVDMVVVHGAAHGGAVFYSGEHLDRALNFLRRTLGR